MTPPTFRPLAKETHLVVERQTPAFAVRGPSTTVEGVARLRAAGPLRAGMFL